MQTTTSIVEARPSALSMRRVAKTSACTVLLTFLCCCTAAQSQPNPPSLPPSVVTADVFVSPAGNDAWTGRRPSGGAPDGPVATLHQARLLIRKKLAARGGRQRNWTVMFRGGTYYLTSKEVFTPDDSSSAGHVVAYTSYPGEHPTISGGRVLTGFTDQGNGRWTLPIREVTVGTWYFGEIWVNGNRATWPVRPVPGTDRFHVAAQVSLTGAAASKPFFSRDPVQPVNAHDRLSQSGTNRFGFRPDELSDKWRNLTDIRIELWGGSTNNTILPLASVDMANHVATMNSHTLRNPMRAGTPWRRLNVYSDLGTDSQVGEMYLDRATGILTYVPRPGETPENSTVIAPVLNQLILISNGSAYGSTGKQVGNLAFTGLTFSHTNSTIYSKFADPSGNAGGHIGCVSSVYQAVGAITTVGAAGVRFDHVTLAHIGESGLVFGPGSNHDTFSNSVAYDLGEGGVLAGDEPERFNSFRYLGGEAPSTPGTDVGNTTISNNSVHDFGLLIHGTAGIYVGRGAHNSIMHNEIHDGPSFGILLGSDPGATTDAMTYGNYIAYNHIYRMGYEAGVAGGAGSSDFGGLYTIGPQQGTGTQPGTIIEYNKVHNIVAGAYPVAGSPHGRDAVLFYFDGDDSTGLTIRNNLGYTVSNRMLQLTGMHHDVYNNIFYSIFPTGYNYGNGASNYIPFINVPASVTYPGVSGELQASFHHNIVVWGNGTSTPGAPQGAIQIASAPFTSDYNLYRQVGAKFQYYLAQGPLQTIPAWQAMGRDVNSMFNVDPLFANAAAGDFTLSPASPALTVGFVPFDLSTVGPSGSIGAP